MMENLDLGWLEANAALGLVSEESELAHVRDEEALILKEFVDAVARPAPLTSLVGDCTEQREVVEDLRWSVAALQAAKKVRDTEEEASQPPKRGTGAHVPGSVPASEPQLPPNS